MSLTSPLFCSTVLPSSASTIIVGIFLSLLFRTTVRFLFLRLLRLFRFPCRSEIISQAPIQSHLTSLCNIFRSCQRLILGDLELLSVLTGFQIVSSREMTFQGCQSLLSAKHAGNL